MTGDFQSEVIKGNTVSSWFSSLCLVSPESRNHGSAILERSHGKAMSNERGMPEDPQLF